MGFISKKAAVDVFNAAAAEIDGFLSYRLVQQLAGCVSKCRGLLSE
jgi:hypothetical protein